MRLLLDTHILLWAMAGDRRLGKAESPILNPANTVTVSIVSYLELAIKIGQRKIDVSIPQIRAAVVESGFEELPVTGIHAEPWRDCRGG